MQLLKMVTLLKLGNYQVISNENEIYYDGSQPSNFYRYIDFFINDNRNKQQKTVLIFIFYNIDNNIVCDRFDI